MREDGKKLQMREIQMHPDEEWQVHGMSALFTTIVRLLLLLGRPQSTPVDLFLQPALPNIVAGKQSLGTPVFASSRSTNVRVCPTTLHLPCLGSHTTKSLTALFFTPPAMTAEPMPPLSNCVRDPRCMHKAPHL